MTPIVAKNRNIAARGILAGAFGQRGFAAGRCGVDCAGRNGGEAESGVRGVQRAADAAERADVFSTLGELRDFYLLLFVVFAVVFLLIWIAAFITGVVLTRQITKAIADLYHATQYVQSGDLTHRVRIERRDQLGVLAESFNLMTGSISGLIEEQKKRQRLENEISIAREVQSSAVSALDCRRCRASRFKRSAKRRDRSAAIITISFS